MEKLKKNGLSKLNILLMVIMDILLIQCAAVLPLFIRFDFSFMDIGTNYLEYVKEYMELEQKLGIELMLSAECAYRPILDISRKRRYLNSLLGNYEVYRNARTEGDERTKVSEV